jgi:hypothetical protein
LVKHILCLDSDHRGDSSGFIINTGGPEGDGAENDIRGDDGTDRFGLPVTEFRRDRGVDDMMADASSVAVARVRPPAAGTRVVKVKRRTNSSKPSGRGCR